MLLSSCQVCPQTVDPTKDINNNRTMMMMMKLVVAVSCVVAASFLVAAADASHYEKPPCGSDEKAVQIAGVNGIFCSPECTPTGSCPTDVPAGVVAVRIILIISPMRGTSTSTLSLARSLMLVILFPLVFLIHSHPFSILSGREVRYEYSRLIHSLDFLSLFVFPCACGFFLSSFPYFYPKTFRSQKPTCALSAPTGEKFCAILCSPRMDEETEKDVGDGECGPDMSCSAIPGAQGFGICDYAAAAAVSATTLRGDSNSVVTTMQYSPADTISAASA